MPRPKAPYPKERLSISLPQETVARLRLKFFSEITQNGLVKGALSEFVNAAILEKLQRMDTKNP